MEAWTSYRCRPAQRAACCFHFRPRCSKGPHSPPSREHYSRTASVAVGREEDVQNILGIYSVLGLTDISSFNLPSAHCIEMTVSVSHVRKMCLGNIIYITRPKIPWSLTGKPTTGSHSAALPLTQAGIVILFWGTSYLLFRKPLSL